MKKNSKKAARRKPQAAKRKARNVELIDKAVQILRKGGVIVYPTETVYGLGADIKNKKAIEIIYAIKGREKTKALSIACLKEDIEKYAEVNDLARILIDNFLPGPITLVLKKKRTVSNWITKSKYVGIRVPDNETAQKIIRKFGRAIVSTSANISGRKDPTSTKAVAKSIKKKVDLVIDEGETKYKQSSTVVQVNGKVKVLRHGVIEIWEHGRVC